MVKLVDSTRKICEALNSPFEPVAWMTDEVEMEWINSQISEPIPGPNKGRPMREHTKKLLRDRWLGNKLSDETKRKMSETTTAMRQFQYEAVNPEGNKITFTNMEKFCKENDLSVGCMSMVKNGKRKNHKGYTAVKRIK